MCFFFSLLNSLQLLCTATFNLVGVAVHVGYVSERLQCCMVHEDVSAKDSLCWMTSPSESYTAGTGGCFPAGKPVEAFKAAALVHVSLYTDYEREKRPE
jgi:hypothetical protein